MYYQEHHQKAVALEKQLISPQEKIDQRALAHRFGNFDDK